MSADPLTKTPAEIVALLTAYDATDEANVATLNSIYRASGAATGGDWAAHLYIEETANNTADLTRRWSGHSALAPSTETVSMYLRDVNGATWGTAKDTEAVVGAYEQFHLQHSQTTSKSDFYEDVGGGNYWQYWLIIQQSTV